MSVTSLRHGLHGSKVCLGIIHLFWEKDGSGPRADRETKKQAVPLYCMPIKTMCTSSPHNKHFCKALPKSWQKKGYMVHEWGTMAGGLFEPRCDRPLLKAWEKAML